MFSMSSLDQTPCRSGSPHGVRGALYSTGLPPNAVTTSAGGVARDCWPETDAPLYRHTPTIPAPVLIAAMNRLVIALALSNADTSYIRRYDRRHPEILPCRTIRRDT